MEHKTKYFRLLLANGWIIERTTCMCGGHWAWLKPKSSGAYEMVGCICHNDPEEMWTEQLPEFYKKGKTNSG